MRLFTQAAHVFEVRMVDVRVDTKQPLEDDLHHVYEILWEGHAILLREDGLVVKLQPSATEVSLAASRCRTERWGLSVQGSALCSSCWPPDVLDTVAAA